MHLSKYFPNLSTSLATQADGSAGETLKKELAPNDEVRSQGRYNVHHFVAGRVVSRGMAGPTPAHSGMRDKAWPRDGGQMEATDPTLRIPPRGRNETETARRRAST